MRFEIEIPDPAKLRKEHVRIHEMGPRLVAHRIHSKDWAANAFNASPDSDARFSTIRSEKGEIIPTLYAAQSFECSVCETILRSPDTPRGMAHGQPHIISPRAHAHRLHSRISIKVPLSLVDISIAGQRRMGVEHNALLAGPRSTYPATRAWAEAIHTVFPAAQGIIYQSHQWGPEWALVLFGDRIEPDSIEARDSRGVSEKPCHEEIRALGRSLGIDYFDI
ncbi:RES family NAD+ phosphorylase [Paracoccus litorisediminis]|uniref:RES family NAD+ phosphorylase n=1 Tax=Paracoccus litorisediminis TaxID=2006130 RepID=UPI0037342E8E